MCFTYVSGVSDNYQQNIKINSSSIATQYNSNDAQSSIGEEVDWGSLDSSLESVGFACPVVSSLPSEIY